MIKNQAIKDLNLSLYDLNKGSKLLYEPGIKRKYMQIYLVRLTYKVMETITLW